MTATSRPTRRQPETLRVRSIMPGLTVNDLQRSIQFYTDGLGFIVEEKWEDDGRLLGVMLKAGDCRIGLSQDDWAKGRDRVKGVGMRIWLTTGQDIEAQADRARRAGITLDEEPKEAEWGARIFEVTDPDGFKISISDAREM